MGARVGPGVLRVAHRRVQTVKRAAGAGELDAGQQPMGELVGGPREKVGSGGRVEMLLSCRWMRAKRDVFCFESCISLVIMLLIFSSGGNAVLVGW